MAIDLVTVNVGGVLRDRNREVALEAICDADLDPLCMAEDWDPQAPFILIVDEEDPGDLCFPVPDLVISFDPSKELDGVGASVVHWRGFAGALAQDLKVWFRQASAGAASNGNMLGQSAAFKRMLDGVARIAQFDAGVLIYGETGTGKELAAREIHYRSERQSGPFVPVNSGAYNDDLFVSEMFGFERGAFTDAKEKRIGLVEQARGGSLFLDEIDSLSPKGQVTLLRFLQDNEFRALGSKTTQRADVRIIAGTNKPLEQLVKTGKFREDLFYRLDILRVEIPALRNRRSDIPILSQYFLNNFSRTYNKSMKWLSTETLGWMVDYPWPGNIRELENYLHKVYVHSMSRAIHAPSIKQLPVDAEDAGRPEPAAVERSGQVDKRPNSLQFEKRRFIKEFEMNYIHRVLRLSKGNISKAARIAGKDRSTFRRLITKYGIDKDAVSESRMLKSPAD